MPLFKKKLDPLDHRARALNAEIAAVEATIKRLQKNPSAPRLRSSVTPGRPEGPAVKTDPIFEPINQMRIRAVTEQPPPAKTQLGVGLTSFRVFWRRVQKHFRAPSSDNPRLVNYLAAGSIQGLRPLRYEKRVARNRFLLLVSLLIVILIGCYFFWRNR